ncbi:hypothetical protein HK105_200045 [Polyrhizophydium stewartii]|uniref:50S ribosomal protein L35 n=1 Tax=Polyrhizophydium stewartii TaxID=2732419 RepID=A0ABR4NKI0_9FUNG
MRGVGMHAMLPRGPAAAAPSASLLVRIPAGQSACAGSLLLRCKHTYIPKCKKVKVASKRKLKHYKLKNHKGAIARWLLVGRGMFKRAQAGRVRVNSLRRRWKRVAKRKRVLANSTQRKLLRKLIPYHKKRYLK